MQKCVWSTNSLATALVACVAVLLPAALRTADACGVLTHIEIAHRASFYYADRATGSDHGDAVSYKALIAKHQDAFQAGNPYPDAMYASICYGGQYHDVAEDSHWTPFMVATIDYIREVYPQPWNDTAERLVVFLLGFTSHQIADVLWHNLGVHDGFLQSMANADFHGNFGKAHPVGDLGGDVVGSFEWDKSYVADIKWLVPTADLVEIYKRYYAAQGRSRNVTAAVIETCTTLLFLARLGEKVALEELFPEFAAKSPFLVEELNEYYIGGLDDNAAWTTLLWHDAATMLEQGTAKCNHSNNPVDVHCPAPSIEGRWRRSDGKAVRSVPPTFLNILDERYASVERVDGGVVLRPSDAYLQHVEDLRRDANERRHPQNTLPTDNESTSDDKSASAAVVYTSAVPYARLGWAFDSGDFNGDSFADLAVGSPGCSDVGSPLHGCVYIVLGTSSGLPGNGTVGIEKVTAARLAGSERFSRFGTSVASLDFDQDGHLDLAVGAPSTGTSDLSYHGALHIFLNAGNGQFHASPNFTVEGTGFHENFGWVLATGDMNSDGFVDLIVSSPFFSTGSLSEAGRIFVYLSHKNPTSSSVVASGSLEGSVWNGWFGHTVAATVSMRMPLLVTGSPNENICSVASCSSPSSDDVQSVGGVSVYFVDGGKNFSSVWSRRGETALEKFGSSVAIGQLFPGTDVLAVASPTADVKARVLGVPTTLEQAGRVYLYNMSGRDAKEPFAVLEGDRRYGRFGWSVAFGDVSGDGVDDLVVTAPLRITDFTEHLHGGEQGTAYVFVGGDAFRKLKWPTVTDDCGVTAESPCPARVAGLQMNVAESKSRFGSSLHLMKTPGSGSAVATVVGAIRSNLGSRMSGSVYVYQ